ncbi:hypothetical protein DOQ73_24310, partial [Salmonella enterica subsp. enterica]|nr:hypothetical protein [Salmonella enterica subsp. enterica serovar Javiana]
MRNLALLLLLLTALNPRLALAEDYYWIQSHNQQRYTSYTQACADFEDYIKKATPTATLNVLKVDSKSIACQMKTPQGAVAYVANVNRYGDGCTPPKVYEASTGKCDFPPDPPKDCSDKAGKPVAWSILRDDPLQGMGVIEYMCIEGCRVAPAGSSTCGATPDGPTPGVCWGLGTFTGTECYPGDGANGGSPPKSPDPTDPTKPPLCPKGWSPTGSDGKGPCMSNPDPNDPDNPDPNNPDPNNPDPNNPNPGGG